MQKLSYEVSCELFSFLFFCRESVETISMSDNRPYVQMNEICDEEDCEYPGGSVVFPSAITEKTTCSFDVSEFPFDIQRLHNIVSSRFNLLHIHFKSIYFQLLEAFSMFVLLNIRGVSYLVDIYELSVFLFDCLFGGYMENRKKNNSWRRFVLIGKTLK